MWYFPPRLTRRLFGDGVLGGMRPALVTGLPRAADANIHLSTRTLDARPYFAARPSIFERAQLSALKAKVRAWSDLNDHAHVDRRAPPGGNPGGRDQGKSNRGI
jgi:hypothetical protein